VLGQVSFRLAMADSNIDMLRTATVIGIGEAAFDAVLCVFAVKMVRQIATVQEARQAAGERYDTRAVHCASCGEPVTSDAGRCPLCGAGLEDALVVVE
jgi:hypothetical protein